MLPDESILRKTYRYLQNFYYNYTYEQFLPLYHGTSNLHWEYIKRDGFLRPRGERYSTWSDMPSRQNLVYFAACEEGLIPSKSAFNARKICDTLKMYSGFVKEGKWKKDDFKNISGGYEYIGDPVEKCDEIYLILTHFDKYVKNLVSDEDNNFFKMLDSSIYSDKISGMGSFCYRTIERDIITIMDCIWLLFGFQKLREMLKNTIPPQVTSLYSNTTFAIDVPISVDDLIPVTPDKINEYVSGSNCLIERKKNYYGCSAEDFKVRDQFCSDMEYVRDNPSAAKQFKVVADITIKKYKQYLMQTKIPRFQEMIGISCPI